MKNNPSSSCIDQAIAGLAVILVVGTLILPFAKGASIGAGPPNVVKAFALDCPFTVSDTANLPLPLASWPVLGQTTYALSGPGSYPFIDPGADTNQLERFYRVSWQ